MIGRDGLAAAIAQIASVEGVEMGMAALAQDVVSVARAFPDRDDFDAAVLNTVRALALVRGGKVDASLLGEDYEGWSAYHYQHRVTQGGKADMRLMYRRVGGGLLVRGFGHRREPADFYWRMASGDRPELPGREG